MNTSDELTARLVEVWRSGQLMAAEQARRLAPADDDGAWPVQHAVARALCWFETRPTVWKLGGDRERLTAAPVADARCYDSPYTLISDDLLCFAGVELEIAVRLGRDITPGAKDTDIAAAVDTVMPALEVCDVRAVGGTALPATFHLADQQMNHALVLGPSVPGPWRSTWAEAAPSLLVNGVEIAPDATHPLGHPLVALDWLACHAKRYFGEGLKAGDLISTGSWTGLYQTSGGDAVVGRFAELGEVICQIT